jgi:hypothetical protein
MNRLDVLVPRFRRTTDGFRFSLRGLLLFMTVACLLMGLWLRPRPYYVELLLHLDPGIDQRKLNLEKYAEMIQSHLRLVKSDKVLLAAIRDPAVASLSALPSQETPLSWILAKLEVTRQDKQLLAVRMRCTQYGISTCSAILEAIVDSYEAEVAANQLAAGRNSMNVRLMSSQLHHKVRAQERLRADGQSTQAITAEIEDLTRAMEEMSRKRDLHPRIRRVGSIRIRQN